MNSPAELEKYTRFIQSMIPDRPDLVVIGARPVHRPLRLYGQLLKMESSGKLDASICDQIDQLDQSIWSAMVRQVGGELFGRPRWCASAADRFESLVNQQQPSGEFLAPDLMMNLESRWYEELVLLHALTSYCTRVGDIAGELAVKKAAKFHLHETQPDHATNDPWGLLAFILHAPPLADQVLHAMNMQYPAGISGVPLLLLVDVLYGLRRLTLNSALNTK